MQVDSVDSATGDGRVEQFDSGLIVAGGRFEDALELKQSGLIGLDGKTPVDVVLGSAEIAAEMTYPRANR